MHHGQDRYTVTNMSCCIASHYHSALECGWGIHLVVVFVCIGPFQHCTVVGYQWGEQLCCKLEPGALTAATSLPALQRHPPEAGCRVRPASLVAGSKKGGRWITGRNHIMCGGRCLCAKVGRLCKHEETSATTFGLHLCSCSFIHSQMVGSWVLFRSILKCGY